MEKMSIYSQGKQVPEEAKKPIQGGKLKGKTDINPMWRIKKLTEMFGPIGIGWYTEIVRRWTETVGEEICAFVDLNLYIKVDGEWSMPINGTGGSKLAQREAGGIYASDECYKMATTDALSVACKMLGIGADVYWDKDATKYTIEHPQNAVQPEPKPIDVPKTKEEAFAVKVTVGEDKGKTLKEVYDANNAHKLFYIADYDPIAKSAAMLIINGHPNLSRMYKERKK